MRRIGVAVGMIGAVTLLATLTTTSDIGGTPISAPYCVLGNALHILTRNDTTGAIDGEIVAIRNN